MRRKFGTVVGILLSTALAACGPGSGEHKGRVVAGLDDQGVLVAVLGVCDADVHVKLEIAIYASMGRGEGDVYTIATAETDVSAVGMRVELRRDRPPAGWSNDSWELPDQGSFFVMVTTSNKGDGSPVQFMDASVDLSELSKLPDNAMEMATEECRAPRR